jgi:hypothetical protein
MSLKTRGKIDKSLEEVIEGLISFIPSENDPPSTKKGSASNNKQMLELIKKLKKAKSQLTPKKKVSNSKPAAFHADCHITKPFAEFLQLKTRFQKRAKQDSNCSWCILDAKEKIAQMEWITPSLRICSECLPIVASYNEYDISTAKSIFTRTDEEGKNHCNHCEKVCHGESWVWNETPLKICHDCYSNIEQNMRLSQKDALAALTTYINVKKEDKFKLNKLYWLYLNLNGRDLRDGNKRHLKPDETLNKLLHIPEFLSKIESQEISKIYPEKEFEVEYKPNNIRYPEYVDKDGYRVCWLKQRYQKIIPLIDGMEPGDIPDKHDGPRIKTYKVIDLEATMKFWTIPKLVATILIKNPKQPPKKKEPQPTTITITPATPTTPTTPTSPQKAPKKKDENTVVEPQSSTPPTKPRTRKSTKASVEPTTQPAPETPQIEVKKAPRKKPTA